MELDKFGVPVFETDKKLFAKDDAALLEWLRCPDKSTYTEDGTLVVGPSGDADAPRATPAGTSALSVGEPNVASGGVVAVARSSRIPGSVAGTARHSLSGAFCFKRVGEASRQVPPASLVALYGVLKAQGGEKVEIISNCIDTITDTWWLGCTKQSTGIIARDDLVDTENVCPNYVHELWAFLARLGLHNIFHDIRDVLGAESLQDLQSYLQEEHLEMLSLKPLQKVKLLEAVSHLAKPVAQPAYGPGSGHQRPSTTDHGPAIAAPGHAYDAAQHTDRPVNHDAASRSFLGIGDAGEQRIQALRIGEFVFLPNEHFQYSRTPSAQNPQFWMARVCSVGTNGLARLQWFIETPYSGSGVYKSTSRYFVEPSSHLQRVHGMSFHNDDQLWHCDTHLYLRGKLLAPMATDIIITTRADQCRFDIAVQLSCAAEAQHHEHSDATTARPLLQNAMETVLGYAVPQLYTLDPSTAGVDAGLPSVAGVEVANVDEKVFLGGGPVLFFLKFHSGLQSIDGWRADTVTVENVCQILQTAVREHLLRVFETRGFVIQKAHDLRVVRLQHLERHNEEDAEKSAASPEKAGEEATASSLDDTSAQDPLLVDDFVFYANQFFRPDLPENPLSNPRFWVARVLKYFPHIAELQRLTTTQLHQLTLSRLQVQAAVKSNSDGAVCILRWMRETATGSALYAPTQTVILESRDRLKRVVGDMVFDEERGAFEYSLKASAKPRVHAPDAQSGTDGAGTAPEPAHVLDFKRALLEANLERQYGSAGVKHAVPPPLPSSPKKTQESRNVDGDPESANEPAEPSDSAEETATISAASPAPPAPLDLNAEGTTAQPTDVSVSQNAQVTKSQDAPSPSVNANEGVQEEESAAADSHDNSSADTVSDPAPPPPPPPAAADADATAEPSNAAVADGEPAASAAVTGGTEKDISGPPPPVASNGSNREEFEDGESAEEGGNQGEQSVEGAPVPATMPDSPAGSDDVATPPSPASPRDSIAAPGDPDSDGETSAKLQERADAEKQAENLIEEVLSNPSTPSHQGGRIEKQTSPTDAADDGTPKRRLSRRLSKLQINTIERQTTDFIEDVLSNPSSPQRAAQRNLLPAEGWLKRRTSKHGNVGKFKLNFFRLAMDTDGKTAALRYFKNAESTETTVGTYVLGAATVFTPNPATDELKWLFTLSTPGPNTTKPARIHLMAEDEDTYQRWRVAILHAIDSIKGAVEATEE